MATHRGSNGVMLDFAMRSRTPGTTDVGKKADSNGGDVIRLASQGFKTGSFGFVAGRI